jgi:hypothetical protein
MMFQMMAGRFIAISGADHGAVVKTQVLSMTWI